MLEALRRAVARGLVPSGLNISGDDEPIGVLRFTQPCSGQVAHGGSYILVDIVRR